MELFRASEGKALQINHARQEKSIADRRARAGNGYKARKQQVAGAD
jgi:hypothetical protein